MRIWISVCLIILLLSLVACQAGSAGTRAGQAGTLSVTNDSPGQEPPSIGQPAMLPQAPTGGHAPAPNGPATSAPSGNTFTPIILHMTMEQAPRLQEPVTITVTATTARNAPNTSVRLELPESAVLISGAASYQGDLKPEKPVQFTAVVKFRAEGDWAVHARARCVISQDATWGDLATIYLHVGRDQSHFGYDRVEMPAAPEEGVPEPPAITPAQEE